MADVTWRGGLRLSMLAVLLLGLPVWASGGNSKPDVDECEEVRVPEGHKFAFRTYAEGVQIYRWNGESWVFVAPDAVLYAGEDEDDPVGIHYAGPYWESVSGSRVKGAVVDRCTPDPDSIPWLLLKAVSSEGPGIFRGVSYIQRLHTEGGLAPDEPGAFVGEIAEVPYTAVYYFYRSAR